MGPLALMAKEAGFKVFGTDLAKGAVTKELEKAGVEFKIGKQDGKFLQKKIAGEGVDWFVHTSALPKDHAELVLAEHTGLKISKRDELIAFLMRELKLKMVAVAGTHGKTTTTAMIIWLCKKLKIPISYLVGTTLSFAPAGKYDKKAKFFIYEADEYDRNFLHFFPWLAVITVVSYDHMDIYPTRASYQAAFAQFIRQSRKTLLGVEKVNPKITLTGELRQKNAQLAVETVQNMERGLKKEQIYAAMNKFPGVGRRFEKIDDGVYSDYAHHPEEIKATLEMAQAEAEKTGKKGVVAIYEPHQNGRQHEIFDEYKKAFLGVERLFWLPTFLVREDPDLPVLRPVDFVESLENTEVAEEAEVGKDLAKMVKKYQKAGWLVLLMTAGPADGWLRKLFGKDI